MNALGRYARKLKWTHTCYGVRGASYSILCKVRALLGRDVTVESWHEARMDRLFERKFGIETAGRVGMPQLGFDAVTEQLVESYEATDPLQFALLMAELEQPFPGWTFVDFGSGKGRVLLVAAQLDFQRVVGLELSEPLHHIAEQNLARQSQRSLRCRDVRSICTDATTYLLPATPLVLFFFNPFKEALMRRVLDRIEESLAANPRPAIVLYNNPLYRHLFDESPQFVACRTSVDVRKWMVYESTAQPVLPTHAGPDVAQHEPALQSAGS